MFEQPESDVAVIDVEQVDEQTKQKQQPRYNVILWDDNDHTYTYVIRMLRSLFHVPHAKAYKLARCVDNDGRCVCLTTTFEHAELKRDQIHAFGRDHLLSQSAGSMSASIEPVTEE